MKQIEQNVIAGVLPDLDGYRFTTKHFVNLFARRYPDVYQEVVDEYGEGGRGSGRHYSANVHLAKSLSKCSSELGVRIIDEVKAPPDWGNAVITLWDYDTEGTGTVPIERSVERDLADIIENPNIEVTEKEQLTFARIGQGAFRKRLIKYWGGCAVTGCNVLSMLVASHIKPWSGSDPRERLDIYNGLLLVPNLDRLFDQGWISFDGKGKILISNAIERQVLDLLGVKKNSRLKITSDHEHYLAYHRDHIFKG
ncbi:HNH endonuclease [Marinospirillum perlucidum]|uniref:HNH endonuclease n=1 Tax=Marinospirillum perlucidum TaxID=1982602 RepID=UPI0013902EA2|nr:HNH endonuclease [Marinospirillum perlucidum]